MQNDRLLKTALSLVCGHVALSRWLSCFPILHWVSNQASAISGGQKVIEIEAIDFGTLVRVDPIIFKSNVADTSAVFQYLGAVAKGSRVICRFLSTTTADYFTGEPEDVKEWVDNGWIVESEAVHPDAIVLEFWGESDELSQG